ncbi:hypothetical protein PG990_007737 [Apiospora arundinis]
MASIGLDENVIRVLPPLNTVLSVKLSGESAWAKSSRVDVELADGSTESFFMKTSDGHHGRESLKGEFESTAAIYAITPEFCPKPMGWGTFKSDSNLHFYVCKYYDFDKDTLPTPEPFGACLAKLHSSHTSPRGGQYGFHVVTYNGDLPQDNAWSSSWEAFFSQSFRHILGIREQRAGGEHGRYSSAPLETGGNCIKPSLIHGDLWYGNAAALVDAGTTQHGLIFDPSSFWGHNEFMLKGTDYTDQDELGNWRPERNRFTQEYFDAYHAHSPRSPPEEDYDDRNSLYAMSVEVSKNSRRFNLNAAALFPSQSVYLDTAIEEMKRLTAKFPKGYEGREPRADLTRQ